MGYIPQDRAFLEACEKMSTKGDRVMDKEAQTKIAFLVAMNSSYRCACGLEWRMPNPEDVAESILRTIHKLGYRKPPKDKLNEKQVTWRFPRENWVSCGDEGEEYNKGILSTEKPSNPVGYVE